MANYYASARTNYFAVTDLEAFKEDVSKIDGIILSESDKDGVSLWALLSDDPDGAGWIWNAYNEETGDYDEFDWGAFFKKHLEPDWVAIIIEVGAEKLRYLNGFAIAYNSEGRKVEINLDEIYDRALSLGSKVEKAYY
jgi:hypothetical protein